jgi:hypothetical protein
MDLREGQAGHPTHLDKNDPTLTSTDSKLDGHPFTPTSIVGRFMENVTKKIPKRPKEQLYEERPQFRQKRNG